MRLRSQLAGAILAFALLLAASTAARAERTYVTLSFDDGLSTQFAHRDLLDAHGVKGIFHVNTGKVGQPGYMSWDQLRALADDGHEIGGHTVDHVRLTGLPDAQLRHQVCDDRQTLLDRGFDARNFAYPFGLQDATVQAAVAGCGYDTARTTGGLDVLLPPNPDCCEFAERLTPPQPYRVRATMQRLTTPIKAYRDMIGWARDWRGGWINLVLHDICSGACDGEDEFTTRADLFDELLDWILADPDLRVRTSAQVLAIPGDTIAPALQLTAPAPDVRVAPGTTVSLTAEASDAVAVDAVEFSVDGEVVGRDDRAPYAVTWEAPAQEGTVTVTARAVDDAGNAAATRDRELAIVRPPPRPPDPPDPPDPPVDPPLPPKTPDPPTTPDPGVQPQPQPQQQQPQVQPPAPIRPSVRIAHAQRRGATVVVRVLAKDAGTIRRARLLLDGRVVRTRARGSFTVTLRPRRSGRATLVAELVAADGSRIRSAPARVRLSVARR